MNAKRMLLLLTLTGFLGPTRADAAPHTTPSLIRGLTVECSAVKGGQPIVLSVDWGGGGGMGKGTLLSPPASGGPSTSQAIVAQQYKGLVLVDVAGTKSITGALATVSDETTPPRTIRLGDYKQPTYLCQ